MIIYKHTGLKDYIKFISQNGLKRNFIIYEQINKKNHFLHISKELKHLYNVDLIFWEQIKTIKI